MNFLSNNISYYSKHYFVNTHVGVDTLFFLLFFFKCELGILACTFKWLKENMLSGRVQICTACCRRNHSLIHLVTQSITDPQGSITSCYTLCDQVVCSTKQRLLGRSSLNGISFLWMEYEGNELWSWSVMFKIYFSPHFLEGSN